MRAVNGDPDHLHMQREKPLLLPNPQVVLPVNGDPYIGMLETPVTSAPVVAGYLSNLPAYRTGVSPLLRGVEIGLAHGLLLPGPFIKLGPLRNIDGVAEISGSLSAAGLVLILTLCLTIYGAAAFQQEKSQVGIKTLSGASPNFFLAHFHEYHESCLPAGQPVYCMPAQ